MRRAFRSRIVKIPTLAFVAACAIAGARADEGSALSTSSSDDFADFGRPAEEPRGDAASCAVAPEVDAAYDWFRELQATIEANTAGARPEPAFAVPSPTPAAESPAPAEPTEEPVETTDIEDALANFGRLDEVDAVAEPDEAPQGRYDLRQPLLDRVRASARAEAKQCRTRRIRTRKGSRPITKCGSSTSKFLCHQAVKETLLGVGLTKRYLPHVPAKWAHQKGSLKAEGFVNLLETERGYDSRNAPLGAVLVYDGGQAKCADERGRRTSCGHIEIKLNADEYCSDYCKAIPSDRYLKRKLIGVYVKKP